MTRAQAGDETDKAGNPPSGYRSNQTLYTVYTERGEGRTLTLTKGLTEGERISGRAHVWRGEVMTRAPAGDETI